MANVESKSAQQGALEAAVKQLALRGMSAKMLYDTLLRKGYKETEVAAALARLTQQGYLNDTAYAEQVVQSYQQKGYGQARIRQELSKRGIDRTIAQQVLQAYEPSEEKMLTVLEQKLHGDCSDRKQVEKAIAALQRRGFAWGDIRRALESYQQAYQQADSAED